MTKITLLQPDTVLLQESSAGHNVWYVCDAYAPVDHGLINKHVIANLSGNDTMFNHENGRCVIVNVEQIVAIHEYVQKEQVA